MRYRNSTCVSEDIVSSSDWSNRYKIKGIVGQKQIDNDIQYKVTLCGEPSHKSFWVSRKDLDAKDLIRIAKFPPQFCHNELVSDLWGIRHCNIVYQTVLCKYDLLIFLFHQVLYLTAEILTKHVFFSGLFSAYSLHLYIKYTQVVLHMMPHITCLHHCIAVMHYYTNTVLHSVFHCYRLQYNKSCVLESFF